MYLDRGMIVNMNNYEIKQLLNNAVKNNKILHSYMFIGGKLTQKQQLSEGFAQSILCLNRVKIPCQECKSCIEMSSRNHPDFKEIKLLEDGATIKIEQIRELQEDIVKKPIVSDKKVYIIQDSDKMTVRSTELSIKNFRGATRVCYYNLISRK